MNNRNLFALLIVALAGAPCACGSGGAKGGTTNTTDTSIVGFWYADKFVITDTKDPSLSEDVVALGGAYVLNVLEDLRFGTCAKFPQSTVATPDCETGTLSLQDGQLSLAPRSGASMPTFSMAITFKDDGFSGKSAPVEARFGSGAPSTYTFELSCKRVKAGNAQAVQGGYMGILDVGAPTPAFFNLSGGQGGMLFPLLGPTAAAVTTSSPGTIAVTPDPSACLPSGTATILGWGSYAAISFAQGSECLGNLQPGGVFFSVGHEFDIGSAHPAGIRNPGFEDTTAPWSLWIEDPATTKAATVLDTADKHGGNSSLRVDVTQPGTGKRVELLEDQLSLKQGQVGLVTFWAKASPARAASFFVNHRASPWTPYGADSAMFGPEWEQHWALLDAPTTDSLVGTYFDAIDMPQGSIWVDDWTLTLLEPK